MVTSLVLIILGGLTFAIACRTHGQPRAYNSVWYWNHLVPGLREMPDHFYNKVHERLREGVKVKHIPLKGFGFGPTHLFEERTIFGARPLYLEARYKHVTYYLYVCQTPAGLYVSQWLFSKFTYRHNDAWPTRAIAALHNYQQTLFQFDATLMFGEAIHQTVLEILDQYIADEGLTPLEAFERRPILHSYYNHDPAAGQATRAAVAQGRRLPL
jgi:hypothetical protein